MTPSSVVRTMAADSGSSIHVAAKRLIADGDNPHRICSEAAWAHRCGVAPTAGGKTMGEIARTLKRDVAREIYPHPPSTMS